MQLKIDDKGNAVLKDGMPVYVHTDGKEIAFDAPGAVTKIGALNAEAKGHRERAEAAEAKAKKFEGIEDPEAARKAIETLKNIDEGKLLSAGKVEEIKSAAKRAAEEQVAAANSASKTKLDEAVAKSTQFEQQLHGALIGGGFARSKYVTEKMAVHPDVALALFGKAFKLEDGKPVAYDQSGNKVFSREKPGDVADFEEAMSILVDQYPHRSQLLKGSGASGGGAGASNGGGNNGSKTISRQSFDALSPLQRMASAKEGVQVTD